MKLYDIQMLTPLGKRYGQMHVEERDGKLSGVLSLLGMSQPIDGTVLNDGTCEFCGCLITLKNTIEYRAKGMILPESLHFSLVGKGNRFDVTGTRRKDPAI